MSQLLSGKKLRRFQGGAASSEIDPAVELKGKVVAIYFSAHWCPPCRGFTPSLKEFYNEAKKANNDLEIVFVSFDRTADDLEKYLEESHGNWLYVPFGDPTIKELSEKYGVSGIPALIVVTADGSLVTKNGRADVQGRAKSPSAQVAEWKK